MAASAQARAVVERLALGSSRVSRPLHIYLGAVLGAACTVNRDSVSDQCVRAAPQCFWHRRRSQYQITRRTLNCTPKRLNDSHSGRTAP